MPADAPVRPVVQPYRPPVVWRYVWDIVAGTWELVLYVAVMLLAIMLETNARQFRSGARSTHRASQQIVV